MQKQRNKATKAKPKKSRSNLSPQGLARLAKVNNLARHFLANQIAIAKLSQAQKLIRLDIIIMCKDQNFTFKTDKFDVQLKIWKREQLARKTAFEKAFGRAKLKQLKLLVSNTVREITVTDKRKK